MSESTRGMLVLSVAVACYALERAGWCWPARRFDRWLNGYGGRP